MKFKPPLAGAAAAGCVLAADALIGVSPSPTITAAVGTMTGAAILALCLKHRRALIATRLTAAPEKALRLKRGIDRAQIAGMLAMPVSLTGAALGTDAASVAGAAATAGLAATAATLTIANRRAATAHKPLAKDKENKA